MTDLLHAPRITLRRWLAGSPVTGPLFTLLLIVALLSLLVDTFLFAGGAFTWRSLTGILNAATLAGVVTVGVTVLMISGEFDLSVGPLMAMGAYLYANLSQGYLQINLPLGRNMPFMAVLLAVGVPALLGALNGLILVWAKIPSFIVTLGTRSIYRGLVWLYSAGQFIEAATDLRLYRVFNGRVDDLLMDLFSVEVALPRGANIRTASFWFLLVVVVFYLLLRHTRYGNHVYAVGGSPGAAAAQGVNVNRVRVINFAISGGLAGFAGLLLFSQFTRVQVSTGAGFELTAIAAAVVGGALLTGGVGSAWGALVGVLLIQTLRTGVILTGPDLTALLARAEPLLGGFLTGFIASFTKADNFEAIVGATIVGAVVFNTWARRNPWGRGRSGTQSAGRVEI